MKSSTGSATCLNEEIRNSTHLIDSQLINRGWRWWALVALIGMLSLGFRVYYLIHAQVLQPFNDQAHARADGVEYYAYARNLVHHGVFTKIPEGHLPLIGDSFRDPGYPVFLAGWMEIFPQWEHWYSAVLLSQGLLGALSVVFALCLSRRWMPIGWLAIAGIFIAVWPHSVSINSFILSETLSEFLCILGMLLLRSAFDRQSTCLAIGSGIGFALAALTNAILLPFAPLLGIYLAYRRYISARMLLGLMAGALILPVAWMTRNALLPPSTYSSSARGLDALVFGSWPNFYDDLQSAMRDDPAGVAAMNRVGDEIALIESRPLAGIIQLAKRMSAQPLKYACWYLIKKPALLWGWNIRVGVGDIYVYPTRNSPFKENAIYRTVISICHTINRPLFLLMIMGGMLAVWPRQRIPNSLEASALLLIYISAAYTVLQAEPRYSIAYRPLEILLATFVIYRGSASFTSMTARNANRNKQSWTLPTSDRPSVPK